MADYSYDEFAKQRERMARSQSWPVPRADAARALLALSDTQPELVPLLGWSSDGELAWTAARLKTNVLVEAPAEELRPEATWFEGLMEQHLSEAAAAGTLSP